MPEIRVALVGVGNCASALVQGIHHYRNAAHDAIGLAHPELGGYQPGDIRIVAAFDVDERKVGIDLAQAIFAAPNCAAVFSRHLPPADTIVKMGPPLDGVTEFMLAQPAERSFRLSQCEPVDVASELHACSAQVVVNYLPVGAQRATEYYAAAALSAGCAFVNCIPVFIASNESWAQRFVRAGLPLIGDDVKSQCGATLVHRQLVRAMAERGVRIDRTYQLNVGGNTDFLNMRQAERLESKRESKTAAVQSQIDIPLPADQIHVGPSDYVSWLGDNKVCHIRIEGRGFGGAAVEMDVRLSVQDSPNSAGVVIDAVRCAKLALDRRQSGVIAPVSAYCMKHPPAQMTDDAALRLLEEFASARP